MSLITFDRRDLDTSYDPYPVYHKMLQDQRAILYEADQDWCFFGFDDCHNLLKHPSLGHISTLDNPYYEARRSEDDQKLFDLLRSVSEFNELMIFLQNPPEHRRLRSLMHKAFTPRILSNLHDNIEALTTDLLDKAKSKGTFDFITDFALPLPIAVITRLLGVPDDRGSDLHTWSSKMISFAPTLDNYQELLDSLQEYRDYVTGLVEERRSNPQDDLLTELVRVEEEGEKLTLDELLANVILLLNAGHETTVSLISSAMLTLFQHPNQRELLENNLDLMPQAVEECVRYCSPVQFAARNVLEPFEYNDIQFEMGQSAIMYLGAANRDPQHFENPDTFDITREAQRNLGFGMGIHYCLGAPLARMETRIALRQIFERFPDMTLAEENPQYHPSIFIRRLQSLQVTV